MAWWSPTMSEQVMSPALTVATFRVAHLELALPVERVQEVIRRQDLTRVPLAPASVAGLVNLRGQIVTALAVAGPLAVEPRAGEPTALIARVGDELVALLVDDVGDVVEVPTDGLLPVPETLGLPLAEVATGVLVTGSGLVVVIDLDRLLGILR
jgi:purine-binding chemotaxis protein CheW